MLVVISDLHLQENEYDAEAVGRSARNVSVDALNLLLAEIHDKVIEQNAQEVVLCLAGDIFEISRSPLWFETEERPYHTGLPTAAMEPVVQRIFDAIVATHAEFFAALRNFAKHHSYDYQGQTYRLERLIPVEVRFLPGNHDRLLAAWPRLRAHVRSTLGLEASDAPFYHTFLYPKAKGTDPSYGVLVRHGHEYDDTNFSQAAPKGSDRYLYSCLGDVVTSEFVAFYPHRFAELYGETMKQSDAAGEVARHLFRALLDFDDVRPAASLFSYLLACVQSGRKKAKELEIEDRTVELLRPLVYEAYTTVSTRPVLLKEVRNPMLKLVFLPPGRWLLQALIRYIPAAGLAAILRAVGWVQSKAQSSRPSTFAAKEEALLAGTVHTVVAGHTHHPDQVPLQGEKNFFLDSGTWRTLIYQGDHHATFGRLRAITYVFVYRSDEASSGRSFETWTGHLGRPKSKTSDVFVLRDDFRTGA